MIVYTHGGQLSICWSPPYIPGVSSFVTQPSVGILKWLPCNHHFKSSELNPKYIIVRGNKQMGNWKSRDQEMGQEWELEQDRNDTK